MPLALLLGCAHAQGRADGPQSFHYEVRAAPRLDRLDVRLCFADHIPARLVADEEGAGGYLISARALANGRALKIDAAADSIDTAGATGKCLAYTVDLARMVEESEDRPTVRVAGAMATDPHLWLWRPDPLPPEFAATVSFALPAGLAASVPWPEVPGQPRRHRLTPTAFTWASQVVLGKFHALEFDAAGTRFHVAVVDLPRALSDAGLRRWLAAAATTVAGLYGGRFPVPRMQVIVVPYPGGGDPVYFGMALRGGGPAVQLLISREAVDREFPGEWVAIHEFLHHGMPFVDRAEAWLSEGFVTYYTEVLRGRAGFRGEGDSWRALLAGFDRGSRSGGGQSLADASRDMHEAHAYQRVYWGGAAIALLADVALREAGSSLDVAMRQLQRCCAATGYIWSAREILRAMDRALGSDASRPHTLPSLEQLSGPILRSAAFPDLTPIYRKLGVTVVDGGSTLDESASIAHVRRAIFTQPSP